MALIDGLVNYYKLDETSGTTIYDSHGTINGSVEGNVTLNQPGKINKSCLFGQTTAGSDKIALNNLGNWPAQTWSAWVKLNSKNDGMIMHAGTSGWSIQRFGIHNNKFKMRLWSGVSNIIYSDEEPNIGQWYHVVTTFGSGGMKLYINGVLQQQTNAYTGTGSSPGVNKAIGSLAIFHYSVDGFIDEVRIWSRALSPTEISELYNNGVGLSYPFEVAPPPITYINVNSTPTGTDIYLDDVFIGKTNSSYEITAGTHSLKLILNGYYEYEEIFSISEGETKTFNITLEEIPPPPPLAEGFLDILGVTSPTSAHRGDLINFTVHTKNTGALDDFRIELSGIEREIFEGFETGFIEWKNITGDDFNWTRRSGSTSSSSTGPSGAYEGNYYAYTESSSPNYPNKTTYLESNEINSISSLNFNYHMYGTYMGTLSLEISEYPYSVWTQIWSLSGNQGNAWYLANIDLSAYSGQTVKLRFKGYTGTSYTSDMAVDNISIFTTLGSEFSLGTGATKNVPFSFIMPNTDASIIIKTYHWKEEIMGWVWDVTSVWDVNTWF